MFRGGGSLIVIRLPEKKVGVEEENVGVDQKKSGPSCASRAMGVRDTRDRRAARDVRFRHSDERRDAIAVGSPFRQLGVKDRGLGVAPVDVGVRIAGGIGTRGNVRGALREALRRLARLLISYQFVLDREVSMCRREQ
jgi:hypothetical protein